MSPSNKSWDVASNTGRLGEAYVQRVKAHSGEVKTDQWAMRSGCLFVETQSWSQTSRRYEPSGLSVSIAETFFFVIGAWPEDAEPGSVVLAIPTKRLRELCCDLQEVQANHGGENPTRGYLLPLSRVLPMGTPEFRSIPCPRCGNRGFRFASQDDPRGLRECHGRIGESCGHVWDAGEAGREIVKWRPPLR